ncbi:MAG: hypothetical protein IJE08_06580 [Clostridia bacterium]|nr:hypothetical protein [Clostridia bacterium]
MDQSVMNINAVRHAGWSEEENKLLWETADEAQLKGLPLKQVFEKIASQTGRRPNSIRNYYYAQVRQREGCQPPAPRFVPFAEEEVTALVEQVLRARAQGQSVRACLQEMSGGNHSLMLRYQNKYRSVLKNRPELIGHLVEKLKEEGVDCPAPEVRPRLHATPEQACASLTQAARSVTDGELIRACEVLTRAILSGRTAEPHAVQMDRLSVRLDLYRLALSEKTAAISALCAAADNLTVGLKDFLIRPEEEQKRLLSSFTREMTEKLGALEGCISAAQGGNGEMQE